MGRALCIFGLVAAAFLLVLFGADIATGALQLGSMVVDIVFLICALIIGYLSWTTLREQL
jgi:hypothetical protein